MNETAGHLKAHPEGVCLQVKAVPRSSRNQIGETLGDRLKIRITAPPVDSAANEELLKFLAKQLSLSKSCVQLLRGQASRNKTLLIRGLSVEQVAGRLSAVDGASN